MFSTYILIANPRRRWGSSTEAMAIIYDFTGINFYFQFKMSSPAGKRHFISTPKINFPLNTSSYGNKNGLSNTKRSIKMAHFIDVSCNMFTPSKIFCVEMSLPNRTNWITELTVLTGMNQGILPFLIAPVMAELEHIYTSFGLGDIFLMDVLKMC